MKGFVSIATTALLVGQALGACNRVSDSDGNKMRLVEACPLQRTGDSSRLFCANSNAWIQNQSRNWGTVGYTTSKAVTFKITPMSETGTFDPIYYNCPAGLGGEFLWTHDYSFGAFSADIVA